MSTAYSSAKQKYIGNGVTTEWGFDFPIQKHSELKVYLKRSSLPQVLLEEGVDYSFVTENTIAFPIKTGEAKLQATDVLALQRESVFESEYNFSNQQRLEPEEVMHADDNLERQIQELKRDSESAIKVQPTSNINTDEYFIAVESIYENLDNINNVSEHSSEIITCSDNISDISTVSSNIDNVNSVGQSISNVNTVAGNVSSVNTVSGVSTDVTTVASIASSVPTVANNDANITTVATNISDVNTAATNIAAIQDAYNNANTAQTMATQAAQSASDSASSATASSTSANNSHIWAEGTDAQVQALGGVHSSKVWAEQSTNANIALTNSPYTTNRILEIPQDIKLELNNGALTLKAGSKLYCPNGSFTPITTNMDFTFYMTGVTGQIMFFVTIAQSLKAATSVVGINGTNVFSGATAPTVTVKNAYWYDTTNNIIKRTQDTGDTWNTIPGVYFCLPVCLATASSGTVTSIDQIFNGFGYIGSTVFALPGVKVQTPNGRNEDGTYKSILKTVESVLKSDAFTNDSKVLLNLVNDVFYIGKCSVNANNDIWFDEKTGYMIRKDGNDAQKRSVIIANILSSTKISSFTPYTVDSVVNSNASNFSQAGRSYLSGLGMPSSRYIDLTLGASGSAYTAPANGYIEFGKAATAENQYIDIVNRTAVVRSQSNIPAVGMYGIGFIPCKIGDVIEIRYNAGGSLEKFRFIYAQGDQ